MSVKSNSFDELKLRGLFVPLVLIVISFILMYNVEKGPIGDILVGYILYTIILLWIFYKFKKTKIDYHKIIGKRPEKYEMQEISEVTVFVILIGVSTLTLSTYIATTIHLSFLVDFLNQPLFLHWFKFSLL